MRNENSFEVLSDADAQASIDDSLADGSNTQTAFDLFKNAETSEPQEMEINSTGKTWKGNSNNDTEEAAAADVDTDVTMSGSEKAAGGDQDKEKLSKRKSVSVEYFENVLANRKKSLETIGNNQEELRQDRASLNKDTTTTADNEDGGNDDNALKAQLARSNRHVQELNLEVAKAQAQARVERASFEAEAAKNMKKVKDEEGRLADQWRELRKVQENFAEEKEFGDYKKKAQEADDLSDKLAESGKLVEDTKKQLNFVTRELEAVKREVLKSKNDVDSQGTQTENNVASQGTQNIPGGNYINYQSMQTVPEGTRNAAALTTDSTPVQHTGTVNVPVTIQQTPSFVKGYFRLFGKGRQVFSLITGVALISVLWIVVLLLVIMRNLHGTGTPTFDTIWNDERLLLFFKSKVISSESTFFEGVAVTSPQAGVISGNVLD